MDKRNRHVAGGVNRHGGDGRAYGQKYSIGERFEVTNARPDCNPDQKAMGSYYSIGERFEVTNAKPQ